MNWLKQLFSRRRLYRDLTEEIREHLEEKTQELVRDGMSKKDAESAARREFGNVTLAEEDSRDVWRLPSIETFLSDIRYGLRALSRNPGFSIVAILTLALGIGANTAIFSVVYAALIRPLPYTQPSHLITLSEVRPQEGQSAQSNTQNWNTSYPDYLDWTKQSKSFLFLPFETGPLATSRKTCWADSMIVAKSFRMRSSTISVGKCFRMRCYKKSGGM